MTAEFQDCVALLYAWEDNTYSVHICADVHEDGYPGTELLTNHYNTITDAALAMPVGTDDYVPYMTKDQRP